MVQAKSSLFLSAQTMEERKIPSWKNLGQRPPKNFLSFSTSVHWPCKLQKTPKKLQPSLATSSLVDIPGFLWTIPNHRPLRKPRAHQTIQPGKQASSCQGNKPSTLPSRGRRVEVYGKRTWQPNNRYLNSSSERTWIDKYAGWDYIDYSWAHHFVWSGYLGSKYLDGWSKWTARNPGLTAKATKYHANDPPVSCL